MNSNHYIVLGLKPDGISEVTKAKYTDHEIKKAYRKKALDFHPDRSEGKSDLEIQAANAKFSDLKTSSEALDTEAKRVAYNAYLEASPGVCSAEHIFYDYVDFEEEKETKRLPSNPHTLDMVLRKAKGVDLTRLILISKYDSAELLKFAENNRVFAHTLLNNARTMATLSIAQQFELLMIVQAHSNEEKKSDTPNDLWTQPAIKQLLLRLQAEPHSSNYQNGFVIACARRAETAEAFLKAASPHFTLSLNMSLSLAYDFYGYIIFLFKHHAANLDIKELQFLLAKHSENRDEIVDLYRQSVSAEKVEKLATYEYLVNAIAKNNRKVFVTEINRFRQLGAASFLLAENFSLEKKKDVSPWGNIAEKTFFEFDIFNCLTSKETLASFENTFSHEEQKKFLEVLLAWFKGSDYFYSTKKENPPFLQIDVKILSHMLKKMDSGEFENFIAKLTIEALPEEVHPCLIDFIFKHQVANTDHPRFFYLAQQAPKAAVNLFLKNKRVLVALLENDDYREIFSYNESFQKLLAVTVANPKLNLNPLEFKAIPDSLIKRIQAASYLYTLIEKEKYWMSKDAKEIQAEFEIFAPSFKQVGFFDDLLSLTTQNSKINIAVLTGALSDQNVDLDKYSQSLYKMIGRVIEHATQEEKNYIVNQCKDPDVANKIVTILEESFDNMPNLDYINGDTLRNLHAFNGASWGEKYFTAGILEDWNKRYFAADDFILFINGRSILFDGVHLQNDRISIKNYLAKPARESLKEYGDDILYEFEKNLSEKYPNNPVSCFISFSKSANFKNKLAAYDKLKKLLLKINPSDISTHADITLSEIMLALGETGFDKKIFQLLRTSLEKTPYLLSAVLFTLTEISTIFLYPSLRQAIMAFQATSLYIQYLWRFFPSIAMHQIKNARDLSGDTISEMLNMHGSELKAWILANKKLKERLNNTRTLQKILNSMQNSDNGFTQQDTSITQIINELIEKFKALKAKLKFDPQQLQNSGLVSSYYAEISGTVELNKIVDPQLGALLTAFSHENSNNFLAWTANLFFQGNFEKEIFDTYYNHEDNALKSAANTCLAIQGLNYIENNQVSFADMQQRIGLEKVKIILAECFKPSASDRPVLAKGLDYIKDLLKSRRLHYEELANYIANDCNVTNVTLDNLFITDKKLKEDINIASMLDQFFDANDHQKVLQWLAKRIPFSDINNALLDVIFEKNKDASVNVMDSLFGIEIRNKMLLRKASPVVEKKGTFTSGSLLKLKDLDFIKTIARAPIAFDPFSQAMLCREGQVNLLPFYVNGLISAEEIDSIEIGSLKYKIYSKLLLNIDWDNFNVDAVKDKIHFIDDYLEKPYIIYITTNTLERFDDEVLRLAPKCAKITEAKPSTPSENKHEIVGCKKGIEKARQLTFAKNELVDEIVNHVAGSAPLVTPAELNNTLNAALVRKVKHMSELPVICNHRNKIKGFLKGVLGVLLSIPTVFLALLSESYRQTFFSTKSSAVMSNVAQDLKIQGPVRGG